MRSLLSTSRNEFHPAWSPTGNQYAYVTDRTGSPEIWIRSPKEGWERPLITQKDFGSDRTANLIYPSFLPDGRRIAYTRVSGKGEWALWMSSVAGGPPVRVTPGGSRATWSPDGNWIAWPRGSATGFWLTKQKVPGGQPIDLKQQMELVGPQWSPTGEWISCQTPEGLVLASPDGKNHRILREWNPNIHGWSKDGSMIYAVRKAEGGHLKVVSIHIQTGKEKEISEVGIRTPSFELPWQAGFSLAPDGKSFATTVYHVKGDIWLLEGFNKQTGLFERLWKR
jgi:eukaryotic-like serine/threonine-protein kinase